MEENQVLALQSSDLTVQPLFFNLDLNIDHAEGSDTAVSFSSGSDHFDITESMTSLDNASEITRPTEDTTVVDDDDGVGGASLPAHSSLRSKEDQHLDSLLLPAAICPGTGTVYGAGKNDESLSNRGIIAAKPGVTHTGKDKASFAIKPVQNIGPGRYDHKPGLSVGTQSPQTEEANNVQLNEGSSLLNASWKHPYESISEAKKVIKRTEGLGILLYSGHSGGVKKSPVSGSFAAVGDNLMPAKHFCATEGRSSPTGSHWQALSSPCVSSSARKTQVHELNGAIHRLMPFDGIIGFDVDEDSFMRGGVPKDIIASRELGIKFDYRPDSASNVFTICYDPNLGLSTLAQAFFPSDPPEFWQLRISNGVAFSMSCKGGHLDYIPNILAHEFMHILGLRHWNAGFDPDELRESSVLWPDTIERSRRSVMNTGVHPDLLRFSEEDFRVIHEIYSKRNGEFCAGCEIVDVDPYAGSCKL